jgi:hypothetical protein
MFRDPADELKNELLKQETKSEMKLLRREPVSFVPNIANIFLFAFLIILKCIWYRESYGLNINACLNLQIEDIKILIFNSIISQY